jgi:hypothetical protein
MCSEVEAGNFTTSIYIGFLCIGRNVLNMMETVEK